VNVEKDRIKVLFADDDADDRVFFRQAYEQRSDIVLLPDAVNGVEVIEMLKAAKADTLPDLIILDHNMPLMNGKQTLAFLKSDPAFAQIPVCICSTYADPKLTKDCLNLGAYKVSSKPITGDEYQKMMDDFLTVFDKSPVTGYGSSSIN
jgi:CheY-like chemotaxis protein